MASSSDHPIALFCTLHPRTPEKRDRVISHLQTTLPYYRWPGSHCTTWSYFTPSTRPGAPSSPSSSSAAASSALFGFETYTRKSALQQQLDDPVYFQPLHEKIKAEDLYDAPEDLVGWYWAGGFLAREDAEEVASWSVPEERKPVVYVGVLTVREGEREGVVRKLLDFAQFVDEYEPETLTYGVFTRQKAPNEILVFERYTTVDAWEYHAESPTMEASMSQIKASLESFEVQEYDEVSGSFAGNMDGPEDERFSYARPAEVVSRSLL